MSTLNIQQYIQNWSSGLSVKPLIILIGGYAGTGKSTLASKLTDSIPYCNIVPTGVLRSVAQAYSNSAKNPELYYHTFELHNISNERKDIEVNYLRQCYLVDKGVQKLIDFAMSEKQFYIIEGNHILPDISYQRSEAVVIELYLSNDNKVLHKKMLQGPTHQRVIDNQKFATSRLLHSKIKSMANIHNKTIFNCDTPYQDILSFIDKQVEVST